MDFIDHVNAISQQIQKLKDQVLTEEATKNAFILPLINALGYNHLSDTPVILAIPARGSFSNSNLSIRGCLESINSYASRLTMSRTIAA